MVNGLTLFENPDFGKVRVIMRDGAPWFVASDVAKALGYSNPQKAVADHCKYVKLLKPNESLGLGFGPRGVNIIPESDVYALIFRSNLPKADEFRSWVCEVVLPSIRKTGTYSVVPQTYLEALKALVASEEAKEKAEKERDYYKRTKAEIGTKREASAMGTASAAVKRADKYKTRACELAEDNEAKQRTIDDLNDRIGEGETWRTTKAIGWLLSVFAESKGMWSIVGRKLVTIGNEMGISPQEIQHQEYGAVKKHHVNVIAEFKSRLENDPSLLAKYRKSG